MCVEKYLMGGDKMWTEIDNYVSESGTLKFLRTTNNTLTVNGKIDEFGVYVYVQRESDTYRCMGDIHLNEGCSTIVRVDKVVKNQKDVVDILDKMVNSATVINAFIKSQQEQLL